jgi:two-component system response regulator BaeR
VKGLILIVEDEVRLADLLGDYLTQAGFVVHKLETGNGAVEWIESNPPELVVLDLMLPGQDGLSICRQIRAFSRVPVIMTTARVEEIDRLLGLELGADDYICKPYSPREVVARVKAVLRRMGGTAPFPKDRLRLKPEQLRVQAGADEIELSAVEFALLQTLRAAPGRIFSRPQLIEQIYTDHRIVSDRTVDSHVKKLRRRLTELLPEADLIHSVYGVGYRYEDENSD